MIKDDAPKRRGRKVKPVLSETTAPGTEGQKARHLTVVPSTPLPRTKQRSAPDPITGMTDKQEAFCQGVTSGLSLSDAYRAAYVTHGMTDKTINERACYLFGENKIKTRLMQISEEARQRRRMLATSDAELALTVLRKMAEKADTDASKIRAAELLAKAAGIFTEQVEITDKTDRTEDELAQAIQSRLARLGLADKAG